MREENGDPAVYIACVKNTYRLCRSPHAHLPFTTCSLAWVIKQSSTGRGKSSIWHPWKRKAKLKVAEQQQQKVNLFLVHFYFSPQKFALMRRLDGWRKERWGFFFFWKYCWKKKIHLKESHRHLLQFIAKMYFKPHNPPRHALLLLTSLAWFTEFCLE